ncbi:hypothetical protein F53441_8695 [Fusarium austroafricanum]|uniref:F-box domain-containing protein n=1 Tax=Fusarium austroafricanum TaxID=2364996 RepID=A0A8H4KDK2_9HYPO|nr:hypothetical protein F53441_8695 [Fusarium austroafricanum]
MDCPNTQFSDFIESWLETIVTDRQQFQCKLFDSVDWTEMPTPPASDETPTTHRNRSPKRPRHDDASQDTPFDDNQTPRGSRILPPMVLPTHFPPKTPSLSSASSARSGSASPVKRSTLDLLVKPVRFVKRTAVKEQIPRDMLKTCQKILVVSNTENFIPKAMKAVVEAENEETSRSWWYYDHPEDDNTRYSQELAAIREIIDAAESREALEASESAWNVDIHAPLLKLALLPFPSLSREIITHARISKTFVPDLQDGSYYDMTRSKMVDWAITVEPPPSTAQRIAQTLLSRPNSERTVNQTAYGPVRNNPIAISIETKVAKGTLDEARSQLALWVAAWHQRMHLLAPQQKGRIITLPLILVIENEWKLMFACDRGDEIHIVEQIAIGSTGELKEVYRIIAVLRALAVWIETEFMDCLPPELITAILKYLNPFDLLSVLQTFNKTLHGAADPLFRPYKSWVHNAQAMVALFPPGSTHSSRRLCPSYPSNIPPLNDDGVSLRDEIARKDYDALTLKPNRGPYIRCSPPDLITWMKLDGSFEWLEPLDEDIAAEMAEYNGSEGSYPVARKSEVDALVKQVNELGLRLPAGFESFVRINVYGYLNDEGEEADEEGIGMSELVKKNFSIAGLSFEEYLVTVYYEGLLSFEADPTEGLISFVKHVYCLPSEVEPISETNEAIKLFLDAQKWKGIEYYYQQIHD